MKVTTPRMWNSSTNFKSVLKAWDEGSRGSRQKILEDFISKHTRMTAPQIEESLSFCASLFLARVVSWLRLTLQLRSIAIFLSASSGQRFMVEFLEVGGISTVLDILGLEGAAVEDRTEAINVLTHVTSLGRKYKEMICENQGITVITSVLELTNDDNLRDMCRTMLESLGYGNARFAVPLQGALLSALSSALPAAQRAASMVLRAIESEVEPNSDYTLLAVALLRSTDVQVQHEGAEILKLLLCKQDLTSSVAKAIVDSLAPSINAIAQATRSDDVEGRKPSSKSNSSSARGSSIKVIPPAFIQQAAAAKLLAELVEESSELIERFLSMDALEILVVAAANVDYLDSQIHACRALQQLGSQVEVAAEALRKHLGERLFSRLMSDPQTLARSMNRSEADIFKFGNNDITEGSHEQEDLDALLERHEDLPDSLKIEATNRILLSVPKPQILAEEELKPGSDAEKSEKMFDLEFDRPLNMLNDLNLTPKRFTRRVVFEEKREQLNVENARFANRTLQGLSPELSDLPSDDAPSVPDATATAILPQPLKLSRQRLQLPFAATTVPEKRTAPSSNETTLVRATILAGSSSDVGKRIAQTDYSSTFD